MSICDSIGTEKYLISLNYSQFKLAQESELSQSFLNNIESGKKFPSADTLEKLCTGLKVKPYMLFLDDNEKLSLERFKVLGQIKEEILSTITNDVTSIIDNHL